MYYLWQRSSRRSSETLTVSLLSKAETLWVKEAQFNSWKKQFGLFIDPEGVWRCGGRLSNADVPYTRRHSILLPRDRPLTELLVLKACTRVFHNGIKKTLTEVRTRYWTLKGRSLVKQILCKCLVCKRFEGRPRTTSTARLSSQNGFLIYLYWS